MNMGPRIALEAAAIARSQPIATLLNGLIAAAVASSIVATTGQAISAEQAILDRIDEAGTRTVTVTDANGTAGIDVGAVERIAALTNVEWVVALGPPEDVANPHLGDGAPRVAMRGIATGGDTGTVLRMSAADLEPGQALIGPSAQSRAGLRMPAGELATLEGSAVGIVGRAGGTDPLDAIDELLVRPIAEDEPLRTIYVAAREPSDVDDVVRLLPSLLDARDPTSARVEAPILLAEVRRVVQGDLSRFGRNITLLVLAAGVLLIAMTTFGAVALRRKDFGRRRALGASRPVLVQLILTQTTVTATLGAAVGASVTAAITEAPPADFTVATVALTALAALIAGLGPALLSAFQDPVQVLRVP